MKALVLDKLQGFATIDAKGETELSKLKVGSVVTIKITDHRTLDANALLHVWIGQIAKQLSDTPASVKAEIKLNFAIPILREDEVFNGFFLKCLSNLNYEQQLKAMKYISATSLMTKKELSVCMDHIQKTYSAQGIILKSHKEEEQ